MTSTKIKKIISIGVRIAALLLIVLFFVPSICVSCDGMESNFSAFEAATGQVEEDLSQKTDYVLFVILLFPLIILICASIKPLLSVTMSIMNIVSMIIYIIMVKVRCDTYFEGIETMVNVEPKFAFILNILLSLAIIVVIMFEQKIIDKFAVPEKIHENVPYCQTCGAPIKENHQFCANCGATITADSENIQ